MRQMASIAFVEGASSGIDLQYETDVELDQSDQDDAAQEGIWSSELFCAQFY